jgi:hypothetical protein
LTIASATGGYSAYLDLSEGDGAAHRAALCEPRNWMTSFMLNKVERPWAWSDSAPRSQSESTTSNSSFRFAQSAHQIANSEQRDFCCSIRKLPRKWERNDRQKQEGLPHAALPSATVAHANSFREEASTGIRRMTALSRLRLSLSTDFGNAKSSTRGLPRKPPQWPSVFTLGLGGLGGADRRRAPSPPGGPRKGTEEFRFEGASSKLMRPRNTDETLWQNLEP